MTRGGAIALTIVGGLAAALSIYILWYSTVRNHWHPRDAKEGMMIGIAGWTLFGAGLGSLAKGSLVKRSAIGIAPGAIYLVVAIALMLNARSAAHERNRPVELERSQ